MHQERRPRFRLCWPAVFVLACLAATATGQSDPGARLFELRCSGCHGSSGEGGSGPDLRGGRYRYGATPEALKATFRRGIAGTEMRGLRLADHESESLVEFVRSLAQRPSEAPSGNVARGEALFWGSAICGTCHWVGTRGGSFGPPLTEIGWARSSGHLRASILDPAADISWSYRSVRVTPGNSQPVEGLLVNEDTDSIQLRDQTQRLRSFRKSELQRIEKPSGSQMPSYARILSASEVDDLVAYLYSLRGERSP